MSPHAVNSFVSDLVLMAQAMERLPTLEARVSELEADINAKAGRIAELSMDLEQSRSYAASLEQLRHKAEVARDDAEMRFLELDERASKALSFLADTSRSMDAVKALIEGPKPEPVPEPVVSEVKPIESPLPASTEAMPQSVPSMTEHTVADTTTAQGQSEPDPIPATGHTKTGSDALNSSAMTLESAQPSPGPYANKRYYDHPTYVPLSQWLDGGGTEYDYNWRPNYKNVF